MKMECQTDQGKYHCRGRDSTWPLGSRYSRATNQELVWVMVERPVPPRVAAKVPVVSLSAIPRVEVATAVTVLSALIRASVTALGLVRVKRLAPTVVAPRLVRAPAAVVAPVPPEVRARAWVRVRLLAVVVARVVVPETAKVPEFVVLANVAGTGKGW